MSFPQYVKKKGLYRKSPAYIFESVSNRILLPFFHSIHILVTDYQLSRTAQSTQTCACINAHTYAQIHSLDMRSIVVT